MADFWPIAEPYRIKMVEPIRLPSPGEREAALSSAGLNPFGIPSSLVYIDLLTDSGTSAMSDAQWGALMVGDEAYAMSKSYDLLRSAVSDVLGFPLVLPTHQGRAAEHLLMRALVKPGDVIPNNLHFDTTKAHVLAAGAVPVNTVVASGEDPTVPDPFKGNVDLAKLEAAFARGHVPFVMVTVTSNQNGGQPVSLENLAAVHDLARQKGVPLFLDGARFAENACLISRREPSQEGRSAAAIARAMMDLADGVLVSAKKDVLVNIGGFIAVRDEALFTELSRLGILYEGYTTYGGLAGRDVGAMAQGLREAVDDAYLDFRVGQVAWLHDRLKEEGVPVMSPPGGHGVYLDAVRVLPHLPRLAFPAWSLSLELYRERAIRSVEIGTVLGGRRPDGEHDMPSLDLVRLAIPRRAYTMSHLEQVALAARRVMERAGSVRGVRMVEEPPVLRHFTARFEPL